MRVKIVVVDLEIPPRVKNWGLRIGLPLGLLLGGGAVAWANLPVNFQDKQTLTAADLNSNFSYLDKITPWQAYSATLQTLDGKLVNNAVTSAIYRRVGDTMEFMITVSFPAGPSGAASSKDWTVTLPTGLQVDTTKIPTGGNHVGDGSALISQFATLGVGVLSSGAIVFGMIGQNADLSTQTPSGGFPQGGLFSVKGAVPIQGW